MAPSAEAKKCLSHPNDQIKDLITCSVLVPAVQKDVDTADRVQRKATKTTQGQARLLYEQRLRHLGLLSPEKRRLKGNLVTMLSYSQGGYKGGNFLFYTESQEKGKGQWVPVTLGVIFTGHKRKNFPSENNHPLE